MKIAQRFQRWVRQQNYEIRPGGTIEICALNLYGATATPAPAVR